MYLRNYNTNPTLCYIQMELKAYKFKDKTQKKINPSWRRETFTLYILASRYWNVNQCGPHIPNHAS